MTEPGRDELRRAYFSELPRDFRPVRSVVWDAGWDAALAQRQHRFVDVAHWSTKQRCACGHETTSRCEMAFHILEELGMSTQSIHQ